MAFRREPLGDLAAALAHTGHHVQLPANLPRTRPAGRPGSAGAAADSAPARRQPLADLNRRPGPLANGIKEEPREDKVCLRGQQQAAQSIISQLIDQQLNITQGARPYSLRNLNRSLEFVERAC